MQTQQSVGKMQRGPRRPNVDQALDDPCETPQSREQRASVDESSERAARQSICKPHFYGAGF